MVSLGRVRGSGKVGAKAWVWDGWMGELGHVWKPGAGSGH